MPRLRTIIPASAFVLVVLAFLPTHVRAQRLPNLLPDPGFEITPQASPDAVMWTLDVGEMTRAEWVRPGYSGDHCLHLAAEWDRQQVNARPAPVLVQPDTWYELSAWIKVKDVQADGAFVGIDVLAGETRLASIRTVCTGGTHDWAQLEEKLRTDPRATHLLIYPALYRSAGEAWFDDLCLTETDPVQLPPMTDEELFAAVDLTRPDLLSVRHAVERNDYAAARREFLEALKRFAPPAYLFDPTERPTLDPTKSFPAADAVLRHELTFYDTTYTFPDHVYFSPSPPVDDEHYVFYLNWTNHWGDLARAWWETGREEYITELNAQVLEWTESFPQAGPQPGYPYIDWAMRTALWTDVWYRTREATGFTEQARIAYLKSLLQQARYILAEVPPHPQMSSEKALFVTGLMFPQFRESATWVRAALSRMDVMLAQNVYPDGSCSELSTHYHVLPIDCARPIIRLSEANDIALPEQVARSYERLHDYYMRVIKPNGRIPQLNDSDALWIGDTLEMRGRETGREDLLYLGTGGKEGAPPSECSHALPYAGHYVMRSDWTENATYLIVDAGPYGTGHQHHDALSIDLFAGGRSLLVDPGRYTYVNDEWRRFFVGGWAHSGLVVDGQVQNRSGEYGRIFYPLDNRWVSLPGADLVVGTYDGPFGDAGQRPVHWARWVLFRKPDLFVVADLVRGDGEKDLRQMWHFAPMEVTSGDRGFTVTGNDTGGNLLVMPADPELSLELVTGRENPVQGWFSPRFRVKEPATTAFYSTRASLPFIFATVLAPFDGPVRPALSLSRPPVADDSPITAVEILRPDGRELVVIDHERPFGVKMAGGVSLDGELVWLSTDPEGTPRGLVLINGRSVSIDGREVFDSGGYLPQLEVRWEGERVLVSHALPAGSELLAVGATRVVCDGRDMDVERVGEYLRAAGTPPKSPVISDVQVAPPTDPADARGPQGSLELIFHTNTPTRGYALYGPYGFECATSPDDYPTTHHRVLLHNLRRGQSYTIYPAAMGEHLCVGEPVTATVALP